MKQPTKPYEIIYITTFMSESADGDVYTFMALDAFADYLYPPVVATEFKNDDEFIGTLVKFFNGINDNYNRNIHPQSTTYVVDLPEAFHPIVKGMIMNEDNLVYNPKKVKQVFKHVFDEMKKFNKL